VFSVFFFGTEWLFWNICCYSSAYIDQKLNMFASCEDGIVSLLCAYL